MIRRGRFPEVFFGWWMVLAGGAINFWVAGYHGTGFSALFKPIASELGFSRAVTSLPASISRFERGLQEPLGGWLTDRFGPKWLVIFAVFIIALGLVLMNYVNSLWSFLMVWGVILGLGHNIVVGVPIDTAISNWFVRKRGLAHGIRWVFVGLAGVVVLPFIAWLITIQGWRMTCVIGGVIMALTGFPLAWFCFRDRRPEYYGLLPDGATAERVAEAGHMIGRGIKYAAEFQEVEFTLRQALKTAAYWLLIAAEVGHSFVIPAVQVHTIPFLTDRGIDPVKAAAMMAVIYLASIPTRLIGGLIADRLRIEHLRFLLGGTYFLQAVGMVVFLLHPTTTTIYIWFILYGFGIGASFTIVSLMMARYFGRKAIGSIRGTSVMLTTPFGVISPVYAGWVYDTTGNYMTVFYVFAAVFVITTIFLFFASPPKPPAQVTDVRRIV